MLYIYFLFSLNITIEIWYNLVVQKHGETWYLPFNKWLLYDIMIFKKSCMSHFQWTILPVCSRMDATSLRIRQGWNVQAFFFLVGFFFFGWLEHTHASRETQSKRWRVYRNPVWRHIYSWNGKKLIPCLTWSVYQRFSLLLLQSKIRAYVKNGWREHHSCSRQLRTSGRTAKIVYDFYSRPPVWQLRTHIGYGIRIHHWHPLWNFLMKGFLTLVDVLCVLIWIYILREKL